MMNFSTTKIPFRAYTFKKQTTWVANIPNLNSTLTEIFVFICNTMSAIAVFPNIYC